MNPAILVSMLLGGATVERSTDCRWRADPPPILGVIAGSSSFADVTRILGDAPRSDDELFARLCYRAAANQDQTVLVFKSSGVDGWGRRVSSIRLSAKGIAPDRQGRCAPVPLVSQEIRVAGMFHLGMTTKMVRDRLGQPQVLEGSQWTYRCAWRRMSDAPSAPEASGWDISGSAGIVFDVRDGVVESMEVYWGESY